MTSDDANKGELQDFGSKCSKIENARAPRRPSLGIGANLEEGR